MVIYRLQKEVFRRNNFKEEAIQIWVAPSFSTTYNERVPAVSSAGLASTWFFS